MVPPSSDSGEGPKSVRATITFSDEQYRELERLAEQKKVSVAWVVRDAVDHYIAEQWPLLERERG